MRNKAAKLSNEQRATSNEQRATSNEQRADSCPLISVIVPVYKVEKYLDRCVQSIVNQTYRNLEIILVDDGSPDNCPAMCDTWAQKDSRIRVIHQKNSGLSSARNSGINAANGQYLAFVDSDDYILPEMYYTLLKLIIDNDADISVCSHQNVNEDGIPLQDNSKEFEAKVLVGEEILTEWMNNEWRYLLAWNKLCRAELFRELRFPDGRLHEDEYIVHHLLGSCRKSASTSARMYMYTKRDDSIMGNERKGFTAQRIDDVMAAYKDRYNFFVGIGRKDWADRVAHTCYQFIRAELRRGSYLKNFRVFNNAIAFTSKVCLKSSRFRSKFRPLKIMRWVVRNIARDCYHILLRGGGAKDA